MTHPHDESEWLTRKKGIDPKLDASGWPLPKKGTKPIHAPHRTEEDRPREPGAPRRYPVWVISGDLSRAISEGLD